MKLRVAFAAAISMLSVACATAPQPHPVIAITVDDLPMHGPYPKGETPVSTARAIASALKAGHIQAYAFINGSWTEREPATLEALRIWRDAGLPLGNHGWAHRHLSEMTSAEFEEELVRNEELLKSQTKDWRWFRYPFLDEGETAAKRAAAREVLAQHGYKVAAVTMDFSDWAWTAPYARCKGAGDALAVAKLEELYLRSARESIAFHRQLSNSLYGRDIPYVLLLHISAFEARMLPHLLQLYGDQGFRFVTLAEAESDPAYADQVQPVLPAEPQGLDGKARARGTALPSRTDVASILDAMCRP